MMGYGDEDEHAVLLACWLMYLNIPTYIIIGSALPEGIVHMLDICKKSLSYLLQATFPTSCPQPEA